jgi:spermidine synthase
VTYYGPLSGVGLAVTHTRTTDNPHLNIAVIGLGIGTMSSWTQAGDHLRFYEINPQVLEIARGEFTYLRDAPGKVDIALGDARLTMEREPSQGYDVIAVDAFSSDSIPVHLLTREAMLVYVKHLKPTGVAAIHVSNKHLELEPIVRRVATDLGLKVIAVENEPDDDNYIFESDWVLVTKNEAFANLPVIKNNEKPKKLNTALRLWTDDYSNLFQIVK